MGKRAVQSFAYSLSEGINQVILEDDEYSDDHPFVKARPDMFRDVNDNPNQIKAPAKKGKVEQATAAPGEARNV